MLLRRAQPAEAEILTQITLDAKAHWGYTEDQMRQWEQELTISPGYIKCHYVVGAEEQGELLGYIAVIEESPPKSYRMADMELSCRHFIDNLFVHPFHHRRGIGEGLLSHTLGWCRHQGIRHLYVFSDPNAVGFYQRMGGFHLGEIPPSETARPLPLLHFDI